MDLCIFINNMHMLSLKQQKTASVFYCISILKWPWNLGAKTLWYYRKCYPPQHTCQDLTKKLPCFLLFTYIVFTVLTVIFGKQMMTTNRSMHSSQHYSPQRTWRAGPPWRWGSWGPGGWRPSGWPPCNVHMQPCNQKGMNTPIYSNRLEYNHVVKYS